MSTQIPRQTMVYMRDILKTSILKQAQQGIRVQPQVKQRFTVMLDKMEGVSDRVLALSERGLDVEATPAEELQAMRALFTYLSTLIDGNKLVLEADKTIDKEFNYDTI